jgi:hypothetical protein
MWLGLTASHALSGNGFAHYKNNYKKFLDKLFNLIYLKLRQCSLKFENVGREDGDLAAKRRKNRMTEFFSFAIEAAPGCLSKGLGLWKEPE